MLRQPLSVYINWSSYDELSDAVELTEDLAMRQFDHFLRLRRAGVRLDCYLMDCFWHDPDGGYRTWRKPHWRDDGERWLAACKEHGVLPGLWFGCNSIGTAKMRTTAAWADSIHANPATGPTSACLFEGGFLADFMAALRLWYQRGVRVFKLDFLDQLARLPHHELTLLKSEIVARNGDAFRAALVTFRREHPQAVVVGYNGFEENGIQNGTDFAPRKTMDHRWLEALDAFYSGDPRPADVPAHHFWRAKDVYSDHLVRAYEAQGFPLRVIDNAGFMIGTTGTCYFRGKEAWKGMLLLSLARGGWLNTYYGNLDLLDEEDAAWFARAQGLYLPLQRREAIGTFGALPGTGDPYGFTAGDERGSLICVVNPGQLAADLALPGGEAGRILFRDGGFEPIVADGRVSLGPEQLALIGTGSYADPAHDLGVQPEVLIPERSRSLPVESRPDGRNAIIATVEAPERGRLRLVLRQRESGRAKRTSGGAPPNGTTLGKMLTLCASQGDRAVAIDIAYDKAIWSGLSWAVGEIPVGRLVAGEPVTVRMSSCEQGLVTLVAEAFAVE
jgi:hypothetical protein